MSLSDQALVDRFLDMMAAEAGASRNTIDAYQNDLAAAAAALPGGLGEATMEQLTALAPLWSGLAASACCNCEVRKMRSWRSVRICN